MNFDRAFELLVGNEGGYVNDPLDPGGETKYGIAKRWHPTLDIRNLTLEQAKEIYRSEFWDVLGGCPDRLKFQVFDFAVNSGIGTAIRKLQRAIGVADDGHWGPVSAMRCAELPELAVGALFLAERLEFLTDLSGWGHDGRGWTKRVARDLRTLANE